MTKRTLAAATLAALPLATGALQADPVRSVDTAATRSAAEHGAGPQWLFIVGEEGPLLSHLAGCPSGGWRCALVMM